MLADDDNSNILLPTNQGSGFASLNEKTNAAAGRYQYDLGDQGTLGVSSTHRQSDNYRNTVLSVDGSYWFNQSDTLLYQVSSADTRNSDFLVDNYGLSKTQSDQAYAIELTRDKRDYKLYTSYENIGEDYRTDLGYQAKVDYEKSLVLDPHNVDALIHLGITRAYLDQNEDAIIAFTKALKINPSNLEILYFNGVLKSALNDLTGALEDFSRIINIDKTFKDTEQIFVSNK